jgi:7-cyano-7-deazaguanine synthase
VIPSDLIVPYRNLLLLSAGATYAASIGYQTLYSAFINSNHALEIDATKEFLDGVTRMFGRIGGIKLEMPFRDMTKTEVALLGFTLGVPIAKTYSCQVSSKVHCGSCPNCVDRIEALSAVATEEKAASERVSAAVQ